MQQVLTDIDALAIQGPDGTTISTHGLVVQAMGVVETIFIDSILCERLIPRWDTRLQAGEAIAFANIKVTPKGVEHGGEVTPWTTLQSDMNTLFTYEHPGIAAQAQASDFVAFAWFLTYQLDRAQFERRIRILDFVGEVG